jgi:hypothetical protein
MFQAAPLEPLSISVETDPPAGPNGEGAAPNALIRIVCDDYPDPDAVAFGTVLLRSGRVNLDADLRVDLPGRAILLQPRAPLEPQTSYEVFVAPQVRALDGREVGGAGATAQLTVGTTLAPPPQKPARVTWNDQVQGLLMDCAPFCHAPEDASGRPRAPARQLDFTRSPDDPIFGLIGVLSVGLSGTPYPLARVVPGDSARSALLRKVLGGDRRLASEDAPYPEMRVDGRRMPLPLNDGDPPPPPLRDDQVRLLQQWIDDGAPLD